MPVEARLEGRHGEWAFDADVTGVFDDMLARSIPDYAAMRSIVTDVASRYVQPGTDILDLGCSRGEAMAPLVARFGAHNRFIGVEVSEPMRDAARQRFAGYPPSVIRIEDLDLRETFPAADASVVLSVLTLMFVPINHRTRIVEDVFRSLRPKGAFLLVEKVIGHTAESDRVMVDAYHAMKAANGYSHDEIERKRLALEGVQVPVTARWNEELLHDAGFRTVECVWRWHNFGAWLAVKG